MIVSFSPAQPAATAHGYSGMNSRTFDRLRGGLLSALSYYSILCSMARPLQPEPELPTPLTHESVTHGGRTPPTDNKNLKFID